MPNFGQATAAESRWLKHPDIPGGASGTMDVTIQGATMDWYDPAQTEEAYCLHFVELAKPLGCNITNRRMIAQIIGAPDSMDWTEVPSGTRVRLWKEMTTKGMGLRIAPIPMQATQVAEQSAPVREQLAQQNASANHANKQVPPPTEADDIPF